MNTYSIDLRIYERAEAHEIPFQLPPHIFSDSRLKLGYQSITVTWMEETWVRFNDWTSRNGSVVKVIGSEKYSIEL